MNSRKMKIIAILLMAVLMITAMAACGRKAEEKPSEEPEQQEEQEEQEEQAAESPELTEEQIDDLMKQISDKEIEKQYAEYIPDEGFAEAEVFGIDREGDEGTAYVNIFTGEYVVIDDKAYNMTASAGEAIIKFNYTDSMPEFKELIWSADGGGHDKWMEENFSEEYLDKAKNYKPTDEEGRNILADAVEKDVEEKMGVPIDTENILSIDLESGDYVVLKPIEDAEEGEFNTEFVKEGNLSDQKK